MKQRYEIKLCNKLTEIQKNELKELFKANNMLVDFDLSYGLCLLEKGKPIAGIAYKMSYGGFGLPPKTKVLEIDGMTTINSYKKIIEFSRICKDTPVNKLFSVLFARTKIKKIKFMAGVRLPAGELFMRRQEKKGLIKKIKGKPPYDVFKILKRRRPR